MALACIIELLIYKLLEGPLWRFAGRTSSSSVKLEELATRLRVSESEAMRRVVELALAGEDVAEGLRRLRNRGTLGDVYRRDTSIFIMAARGRTCYERTAGSRLLTSKS